SCHAASATGTAFAGVTPKPQGTGHIPMSTTCETCHKSTTAFGPNTAMNHAGITSGCATCHGVGKTYSGTPAVVTPPTNHVPVGAAAGESCHPASTFTSFSGNAKTLMNHSAVAGTPCATCHEKGKSYVGTPAVVTRPTTASHPATGECGTCHGSTASFSTSVTGGMPANHIPTTQACTLCHAGGNAGPGPGGRNHTGVTKGGAGGERAGDGVRGRAAEAGGHGAHPDVDDLRDLPQVDHGVRAEHGDEPRWDQQWLRDLSRCRQDVQRDPGGGDTADQSRAGW